MHSNMYINIFFRDAHLCTSELWFKVTGDKGGDSSKCTIEPMNVRGHNSPFFNYLLGRFPSTDSSYNISQAWQSIFNELEELNGKRVEIEVDSIVYTPRIRLFLGGDLAWLCTILGHCGSSSFHFCGLCYCTLDILRTPGSAHGVDNIGDGMRTIESMTGKLEICCLF